MDVDDQSTVRRKEVTAQQTSLMVHTSSLRLVYRELTVRVIIFTACSTHEQFHCAERLFQQLFVGKEAGVFHDTSPQRIMKFDADVHEEMCSYLVLSGDTTMFQVEHMPTTSAPRCRSSCQNELTVSGLKSQIFSSLQFIVKVS